MQTGSRLSVCRLNCVGKVSTPYRLIDFRAEVGVRRRFGSDRIVSFLPTLAKKARELLLMIIFSLKEP